MGVGKRNGIILGREMACWTAGEGKVVSETEGEGEEEVEEEEENNWIIERVGVRGRGGQERKVGARELQGARLGQHVVHAAQH